MHLKSFKKGDTIVEVSFSIAVFSLVAILTLQIMNNGLANLQANLETTMARNEINAQSEALRYIHNAYLSERELETDCTTFSAQNGYCQVYKQLWDDITASAVDASVAPGLNVERCEEVYKVYNASTAPNGMIGKSFIFNTRKINPNNLSSSILHSSNSAQNKFHETYLYPRLVFGASEQSDSELYEGAHNYNTVSAVEGIWITAVKSGQNYTDAGRGGGTNVANKPEYYDFHIYSCWNAPGRKHSTTIGTIIRLYNPEIVEPSR